MLVASDSERDDEPQERDHGGSQRDRHGLDLNDDASFPVAMRCWIFCHRSSGRTSAPVAVLALRRRSSRSRSSIPIVQLPVELPSGFVLRI